MILDCREGLQCECGKISDQRYDSRATDIVKQEFAKIVWTNGYLSEVENGDNSRIDSVASRLEGMDLGDVVMMQVGSEESNARSEAIQLWSYIVTEYTARDLTYDSDRLVAIAGVAKKFANILKSGYIAGQWTFSILDLLWHPNNTTTCRRPQGLVQNIPSWSWASVEGSPIFFDTASAIDLACVASFPGDEGRTLAWSPLTGETLQLSAAMATEVSLRIDGAEAFSLTKNGISVEFTPDIVPPQGYDELVQGETLVCVLVSMTFRSSVIGLVLKASNVNPEIYRRVGRFECYECRKDGGGQDADDAESLFGYWFPDILDMTQLDSRQKTTFVVV